MNDQELRRLLELVITQERYDGRICPGEPLITGLLAGTLEPRIAGLVRRHIEECTACRVSSEELASDAGWFVSRKDRIFRSLTAWAAREGLEPWHSCPSPEALDAILAGRVADGPGRDLLLDRFADHCRNCSACAHSVENRADRPRSGLIALDADWDSMPGPGQAVLRATLSMLQEVATSGGPARPFSPELRRATTVTATYFDSGGALLATPAGRPTTAAFGLEIATLDPSGRLRLTLSSPPEPESALTGDRGVVPTIDYDRWGLVLPRRELDSVGRVAYDLRVAPGIPIPAIPWWMIRLTATVAARS